MGVPDLPPLRVECRLRQGQVAGQQPGQAAGLGRGDEVGHLSRVRRIADVEDAQARVDGGADGGLRVHLRGQRAVVEGIAEHQRRRQGGRIAVRGFMLGLHVHLEADVGDEARVGRIVDIENARGTDLVGHGDRVEAEGEFLELQQVRVPAAGEGHGVLRNRHRIPGAAADLVHLRIGGARLDLADVDKGYDAGLLRKGGSAA